MMPVYGAALYVQIEFPPTGHCFGTHAEDCRFQLLMRGDCACRSE